MTELLTIGEVAFRLRCSKRQVHRYIAEGRLRVIYIAPRSPRVKASEVEAFIAHCARRAA